MRTILAKLFWHFDLMLQPESTAWDQAKSYIFWEKGPLYIGLKEATVI
jgi:hypothetical protein